MHNLAALVAWALLEARQRQYDLARSLFEKALRVNPLHGQAYNAYAMMERNLNEEQRALDIYQRGLENDACSASLYHGFAQLRKAKGLTQKELAQKLNVSQSVVSDYEHGALRLHGELIIQLAKLLNVGTDELLGLSAEPIPSPSLSRRLLKRMQAIEQLPKRDQDALLRTIDAFVTRTN